MQNKANSLGVSGGGWGPVVQNEANWWMGKWTPTAAQKRGYAKNHGLCLRENKPNFQDGQSMGTFL